MSITTYSPSRRKSFVSNVINAVEKNKAYVPVNIKEDENNFFVELVVPGYKKEFFSIEVENNRLNIKYVESKTEEENTEKILVNAYSVKDFEKSFKISDLINVEALEAKFNAGILAITLPKSEEKKPVRIEVK